MRTPSHRHSWRRGATLLAAIFSTRLLVSAIEARVVIIYGSATRNTTAPSEDQGLAGWDLEAQFGNYTATGSIPTAAAPSSAPRCSTSAACTRVLPPTALGRTTMPLRSIPALARSRAFPLASVGSKASCPTWPRQSPERC